tara:strand:- start:957 stop:2210 length:1254 start_codon:yes stop_codon:yes gene_type:complete
VTIEQLYDEFVGSLGLVNQKMAKQFLNAYWIPYFGSKDISKLNSKDLRDYFKWRVDEYIHRDHDSEIQKAWRASATSISYDNLKAEKNCLRVLLRKGYGANIIPRLPNLPDDMMNWDDVHVLPRNNRRGRFTKEQYTKLMQHFAGIRRGLTNKKNLPALSNPKQPFHAEDNRWISQAKRLYKTGKFADPIYGSHKCRYPRAVFWFASLLMSNTGIRVSELVKLRHRDIKLIKDETGQLYTVVHVDETVSKLRRTREAISADGAETFKRYLLYKQELQYHFQRDIKDTDWVFPQTHGKHAYVGHRHKIENRFRDDLKRLGMHEGLVEARNSKQTHMVRVYYSAYSFRSWYITQRLANQLDVYTISKNCGVSIKTLMASYDVNETWVFRKQMVQHLNQNRTVRQTDEDDAALSSHILSW